MEDQYIGEIRIFAGNYAPEGWEFCNGQQLAITNNEILFSLIGVTYGGDGVNTFALPDLRGRIPVATGTSSTGSAYVLGQRGGTETVSLTQSQLPAHTHVVRAQNVQATEISVNNAVWANTDHNFYSTNAPNESMDPKLIMPAGGSQSHDNMMPYIACSFIIAMVGIYPSGY